MDKMGSQLARSWGTPWVISYKSHILIRPRRGKFTVILKKNFFITPNNSHMPPRSPKNAVTQSVKTPHSQREANCEALSQAMRCRL